MRQVGLTNNEIQWAKDKACDSKDNLHQMLLEWHSKTGQGASVNTLLKALQKTENIQAMEEIEEELVRSGVYAYEDGDSAVWGGIWALFQSSTSPVHIQTGLDPGLEKQQLL